MFDPWRELEQHRYAAAKVADALCRELVNQRESFVFETVFSDPVGDKLTFLMDAAKAEYTVVLCFIGISGPEVSEERVAMRVSQGGHDVPSEKLVARFPRTIANLKVAIQKLPHVLIFDNDDLRTPFRRLRERATGFLEKACAEVASIDFEIVSNLAVVRQLHPSSFILHPSSFILHLPSTSRQLRDSTKAGLTRNRIKSARFNANPQPLSFAVATIKASQYRS